VWVAAQDSDAKRFATLDLYAPMLVKFSPSGMPENLPPPHIIFSATNVLRAEEFDAVEADQYHKGVIVTFAPNAWVNEAVHSRGLKECLGPQIERMKEAKQKVIVI